jgi:regulator of RNase E activity RraA
MESRWIGIFVAGKFHQTWRRIFLIAVRPCIERRRTKEPTMKLFVNPRRFTSRAFVILSLAILLVTGAVFLSKRVRAEAAQDTSKKDDAALIESFRHVEVASVSDALEQILGKKLYMTHRMRPIFASKFAGFALTVHLKKDENEDPAALNGMLSAIDEGARNSVYVMQVDEGADIAGMGGLMGTAMSARNFSGAVIDGGVRDVAYLTKIGFPVFATGIVPSTSVHHYRFAGANIPIQCDGVTVRPGDIVVADADGVAAVPRESAEKVLALAQQLDFKEHSMYPIIERARSIMEGVKQLGRL